jgi:hypothetical protein
VFVIDQAADVVFCGVGAEALFAMLFDAEADVVGESYIKTAGAAGEDVDVEVIFPLRHVRRITEESVVGKQIPPLRCGMTNKGQVQKQEQLQRQKQKQIPPIRCGMTNKRASAKARTTATATATAEADSSASLRNDKQRRADNSKMKGRRYQEA